MVGPKRRGPQVDHRAKFEQHGGGGLVIGGFEYGDYMVGTDGSVGLLDPHVMLLGERIDLIAPMHAVLGGPYTLVGPVH